MWLLLPRRKVSQNRFSRAPLDFSTSTPFLCYLIRNDISGFQNRLGTSLLFKERLMPNTCVWRNRRFLLHAISVRFLRSIRYWFIRERETPIYARKVRSSTALRFTTALTDTFLHPKRANGYYSSFTYFASKVSLFYHSTFLPYMSLIMNIAWCRFSSTSCLCG